MTDPTFPNPIQDQTNTPPPTFPEMTDIPTIPVAPQEVTTTTTTTTAPIGNTPTEEINQTPVDIPPMVTTEKKPKKKGGIIATILGIFLLIGAVGAGVVLINQNQDIREKASIDPNPTCTLNDTATCTTALGAGTKTCIVGENGQLTWSDCIVASCLNESATCSTTNDKCCEGLKCTGGKCQEIVQTTISVCKVGETADCNTVFGPGTKTCVVDYSGQLAWGDCVFASCLNESATCSTTNDKCCEGLKCTGGKCQEIVTPSIITTTCSDRYTKTSTTLTSNDFPTCYVNHYWCSDGEGDSVTGCSDQVIASGVKSASYIKDCGIEQIDFGCTDDLSCKAFISHPGDPCDTSTTPPSDTLAACTSIKVYDSEWNLIPSGELPLLSTGDQIYFTVSGTPATEITKARFTINGTVGAEVTDKKTGTSEYYTKYTIPEGVTSFTVSAQIYHTTLGWF